MIKHFSRDRIPQAAIAWLLFFTLVSKPICSIAAGPSTQSGWGSIPYSGIWSNGSQAGSGFGAWQFNPTTNNANVSYIIQSSVLNENGGSPGNGSNDINTGGAAWGITAQNGTVANATRPFPSGLTTSQSFQIDMDNGNIVSGGSVGFALQNGSGNSVLEFYFQGGTANYTINAGSTNGTALPFTRDGLHLTFSLPSVSTYSLSVLAYTPGGSAGVGTTYNYSGNLLNPSGGQTITSVRLFNFQGGAGTNNTAYFNSLSISGGAASDNASAAAYTTAGTTFRVWAPNATAMHVSGTWNSFSTNATLLYSEGNGNWSADVPGALNGHQYKYYISNSTVGTNIFKQDPRCRQEISESGNSVIYNTTNFNWSGDAFSTPALGDAVVYEMHISSFYNPNGGSPGTFYNATNKLAFLKQLGVSVVEVMPINEFPWSFSWGYNPVDLFGVESSYGGPDAFKSFVKTAHQLGIAVLVDVVHNHYGSPDAQTHGSLSSGLWDFDGYDGGLNGGGIYFYQTNGWCCTPWGPRPNASSPQVRAFIQDSITMWLSECHVDGFRWDAPYDWMNTSDAGTNIFIADAQSLIQQVSSMIHTAYAGKINIGENSSWLSGTAGFDSTWYTGPFQNNLVSILTAANDSARNMSSIDYAINVNNDGGGASGWGNVLFTDTHDSAGDVNGGQRLPVLISGSNPVGWYARKLSTLGAAVYLTTPGIPMILQGAEMLVTNQFSASNPLDWSRTNSYSGIVSLYQDLIHLRRNLDGRSPGLKGLNVTTIWRDDSGKLIAYRRWNTGSVGDDVVVICNFSSTTWPSYDVFNFPHTGVWYTQFNSDWAKYGSDYGNYGSAATTVSVSTATISIAPYSVLILSQNLPAAPGTPQNLKVTNVTTNQISLGWNISSSAAGYIVKRGGSPIAATSTNAYTDTGLVVGASYCYSVDATNIGGVSADSATVCATTLPATGATNLLAHWTFDEGSGSIAYDYSGNNNTGTVISGSANWTSGMVNGALYFDGNGAQVTASNSASLNPVNGITLAAWVHNPSDGWYNTPRILEKGTNDNQYALFINSSGSLEFLLSSVSNGLVTVSPPSPGVWHHLAGTYDGSSLISLYIDGLLATQQVASGALPITTDPLAIGNKPGSGNPFNFFYGTIDDVCIYGSALSAAQITQLYNTDSVADGIPNWWRMQYFGYGSSTDNTSCAACDDDGTGQNNFFKYVVGLNPTDPAQIFVVQIAASNQVKNLTFGPINPGRTYGVQSSSNLVNYGGLSSATAPQTNGNQITVTDLGTTQTGKFYRIHISLP